MRNQTTALSRLNQDNVPYGMVGNTLVLTQFPNVGAMKQTVLEKTLL